MNLYPGIPVLYRWRPGQVRCGIMVAAAQILCVRAHNICDFIVHPAGAREPMYFEGVPLMARVLKAWFRDDVQHSAKWRQEAKDDFDFLAGRQWTPDEESQLNEQLRPKIVFNRSLI